MFRQKKAAQAAAYFLVKRGGTMSHMKLIKLLYLSERLSVHKFGDFMIGDRFVSMKQGPVMSDTLNCINSEIDIDGGWSRLIAPRANHEVSLARSPDQFEFDELSQRDKGVLDEIYEEFGSKSRWELVEYTHTHCKEWVDPGYSSEPIQVEKILDAVGYDKVSVDAIAQETAAKRILSRMLPEI